MVSVRGLTFGYRPDEPIIDGLDHDFEAGMLSAVTGASGRGKSTLLYLIGLLLTPWRGRIDIGDVEAASTLGDGRRAALRASHIGFVFQDAMLDPSRNVIDNVVEGAIYAGVPRERAMVEAAILLDRFGVGLRRNHRPGEVSGGQAQRVALCRALLNHPDVILADEPTGNLDSASADVVVGALQRAAHEGGATVIIATHDSRVVALCDRVVQL
ncbi:MAG TPA: ATP-binding cassette domain-containing protein [Gemmatimonadales bacterium]|nr:ATP-binding cassette domain-containing protein [Gemmatimonadales bacterium]